MKLLQHHRESICEAIIAHRFDKDVAANLAEENAIAKLIYERVYSSQVRMRMENLPEGWLVEAKDIACKIDNSDGYYGRYDFGADNKVMRRVFAKYAHGTQLVVAPTDKLAKRISAWNLAVAATRNERNKAEKQVDLMLKTFSTVDSLKKGWPEIVTFVDKVARMPVKTNLPAIQLDAMNAMLKLPPKAKQPTSKPGKSAVPAAAAPGSELST